MTKGSFDLEAAAARINTENRRENARTEERRQAARKEGERLASLLRKADPHIVKIWGFGSAFETGRPFRMDSDIDLALEGGDIVRLHSITLASPFKVDLVDITGREDGFARAVRSQGVQL
jgi:hypothetical protein